MSAAERPELVLLAVQSSAIVDHVALVERAAILREAGEEAGSQRVSHAELERLLSGRPFTSSAGGSAANTLRGLASGFGLRCGVVGAVGDDAFGELYCAALANAGVDTARLVLQPGRPTGRCAVLVDPEGQRTMRTALDGAACLQEGNIAADCFSGCAWVSLSLYALYTPGLAGAVVGCARLNGCHLALHLGSWELVRRFRGELRALLTSGCVRAVFCNEREAREFAADEATGEPGCAEDALEELTRLCGTAVVTLGPRGCVARCGAQTVRQEAVARVECVDSTAAGDLFAAGFLAGLTQSAPLDMCAKLGCLAGAAAVTVPGADVSPAAWKWAKAQLSLLGLPQSQTPASQSDSCPGWLPADTPD